MQISKSNYDPCEIPLDRKVENSRKNVDTCSFSDVLYYFYCYCHYITILPLRWATFWLFFHLFGVLQWRGGDEERERGKRSGENRLVEWYYGVIICNVCINIIKMHARKCGALSLNAIYNISSISLELLDCVRSFMDFSCAFEL